MYLVEVVLSCGTFRIDSGLSWPDATRLAFELTVLIGKPHWHYRVRPMQETDR